MSSVNVPSLLTSAEILEHFRRDHARDINLTLRPAYLDLLEKLGSPHRNLPPVIHVAGTNGKGSTCAFLRAILEAAGYKVHVYTSPHLVHFHERIRVAGALISEPELVSILNECRQLSIPGGISYFEAATAAAFTAFARQKADYTILETGLGGRLDATNVVDQKLATIITRLSYDHREYLGDSLAKIALEKAGIMRRNTPCYVARHNAPESLIALEGMAREVGAPLSIGDRDWSMTIAPAQRGFHLRASGQAFDVPQPVLKGRHQLDNAGLAITALLGSGPPLTAAYLARGVETASWPARLQRLETGALAGLLPSLWELWLDGGHNDSAGEVLGRQAEDWEKGLNGDRRPLHLICGMLTTKIPSEFLGPLIPFLSSLQTIAIPGEEQGFSADTLALAAKEAGMKNAMPAENIHQAILKCISNSKEPGRILICGSLYLAGAILNINGA